MVTETSSAVIVGEYRYKLVRRWWGSNIKQKQVLRVVMLNPSTADAREDDPTIRRCMAFARRDWFGGIIVYNLFAYRATDPSELLKVDDPIGPDNDRYLGKIAGRQVLVAWGRVHSSLEARAAAVIRMLRGNGNRLCCLGCNANGSPKHPLYIKGTQPLEEF